MAYMMSDPAEPLTQPEPIKVPPNFARLAKLRGLPDKAHVRLQIDFDVTHLREDGQKLLLHWFMSGLVDFDNAIKAMNPIEVSSKLAKLERGKATKGNGQ
jgi:hypothetical protein